MICREYDVNFKVFDMNMFILLLKVNSWWCVEINLIKK